MKKPFYILAWIAIVGSICLVLLITYWLAWPYKIAEQKAPAKVLTPIVKLGDNLRYELDFCKYTDISPIDTKKQLVDGLVYPLPVPAIRVLPVGCRKAIAEATIIIPDCAECFNKDVYLELISTYQVNPLRTVTVKFTTEKFQVVK
jgi:hypothetical protein